MANLLGKRYGRLVIIEELPRTKNNRMLVCKCDCGGVNTVSQGNLISGRSTSCGCLRSEKAKSLHIVHGESGNIHKGRQASPEYRAWKGAKDRCYNSTLSCYHRYGGRGIEMCSEWALDFEAFLRDMGRKPSSVHSLDRINNDGDYEPKNCRWATKLEQMSNMSRNRFVQFEGEKVTLAQAGRILGVHPDTARKRLAAA